MNTKQTYSEGWALTQVPETGYAQVLTDLKFSCDSYSKRNNALVPRFEIPKDKFLELLRIGGSVVIKKGGENKEFVYDDNALKVATQLYLYTIGSNEFSGDLRKGIALMGSVGCGKTVIMSAYVGVIDKLLEMKGASGYPIRMDQGYKVFTALSIYRQYNDENIEAFAYSRMFIDEVGREPKTSKYFGKGFAPITEVLFERHRHGLLTHMTTNFSLEDLCGLDMYGPILGDRLKQMFNFIKMDGGSRRE